MKDTLIIGSEGYIGSAILNRIKNQSTGVDREGSPDIKIDYSKLTKKEISKYKNVILLAGNPNPASCKCNPKFSLNNNIVKFVDLLQKINKKQKFIYASSSCVYDSREGEVIDESCNTFIPMSYYDITKKVIDYYASLSDVEFYSLRFGSVNGLLQSNLLMRDDIIINIMTKNAIKDKLIKAINPNVNRAILGIQDLCRAVEIIINEKDNRGIYNLSSFNSTVGDIANFIGNKYNAEVDLIDNNSQKLYDFQVSSKKFSDTYNFIFNDDIDTITNSISNNIDKIDFIRRTECIKN
jgi:nucleoside-diphosphate-sugar epimerase